MSANQKTPMEQNDLDLINATPSTRATPTAEFDFDSLRPVVSKQGGFSTSGPSKLTVVNTEKYGKRIALASEIIETIGSPSEVQVFLNNTGLVISEASEDSENPFRLRVSGNKYIIYSSDLVQEITNAFQLNFSQVTSVSFQNVQYITRHDQILAFVELRQQWW